MRLALRVNDLLTFDRNHIADRSKHIAAAGGWPKGYLNYFLMPPWMAPKVRCCSMMPRCMTQSDW